ncbi:hypothetical protein B0T19DRAFT_465508 [Cercophora scortea]|uniref:Nephrocystin 3-like N-terminal domain-containing protein n=1 Tax=Cercophora scortea TaxID=314031 RepID=A0AAE0I8U3_9PEZI|nr:hypothetical protein B0T19DRAFT_465508 [Cercophora scortea]
MDPLSALSVATAVVAFVDFGAKLATRSFEIANSRTGQPPTVVKLRGSATELASIAGVAHGRTREFVASYRDHAHADAFARLEEECHEVERKLAAALKKLTAVPKNKWTVGGSRAWVAFRSIWDDKEMDEWQAKLDRIRSQVKMHVLMCIWEESQKTSERARGVEQGVGDVLSIVRRMEGTMSVLHAEFTKQAQEEAQRLKDMGSMASSPAPKPAAAAATSTPGLALDATSQNPTAQQIANKILEGLRFEGMTARAERIPTAYPETFQWLFSKQENFKDWLRLPGTGLFWITGKPASGKSTLMKYISTHSSLRSYLSAWADGAELLIASIYFWGPGSLLYQLLSARPHLCNVVTPGRYSLLELAGTGVKLPEWEWAELMESLNRLAAAIQGRSRLALFVDGLDEYLGDQEGLVKFLKRLQQDYGLKLCVSSRPWNVFSDEFEFSPSLRMEDLTKPDIDIYIQGSLGTNLAIQQLQRLEPASIAELLEAIRSRAQGVFLWVVLVVEQLRITVRDNPRLSEVWKVFNSLPSDLEQLYEAIESKLDAQQQQEASKLYQLVMVWKRLWSSQVEATFIWLAVNCIDPTEQVSYPDKEKEPLILPLVTRLLSGHTKGILQIFAPASAASSIPPKIDFLHRTAFDWLRIKHNWSRICAQGPPDYQPVLVLIAVLVSHLRAARDVSGTSRIPPWIMRHNCVIRIFKFAREIDDTPAARAQLVTILDRMETSNLLRLLNVKNVAEDTGLTPADLELNGNLATWAALLDCLPYLEGKFGDGLPPLEEQPAHTRPPSQTAYSLTIPSPPILLPTLDFPPLNPNPPTSSFGSPLSTTTLSACVLGTRARELIAPSDEEPLRLRRLDDWDISRRLDTLAFLLQHCRLRTTDSLWLQVYALGEQYKNDKVHFKRHYWSLVRHMLSRPEDIGSWVHRSYRQRGV